MDGMEKLSRRFRTLLRPRLRLARPGFYFMNPESTKRL